MILSVDTETWDHCQLTHAVSRHTDIFDISRAPSHLRDVLESMLPPFYGLENQVSVILGNLPKVTEDSLIQNPMVFIFSWAICLSVVEKEGVSLSLPPSDACLNHKS